MLTSRERPPDLEVLGGSGAVHQLELQGLGLVDGQALLSAKQLSGDAVA